MELQFAAASPPSVDRASGTRLQTLVRTLFLAPYGAQLLSPAAAVWMVAARVNIFLMCSAEALSWAYFGMLLTPHWPQALGGVLVGVPVFDTLLAVYIGSPTNLTTVVYNDNAAGTLQSRVQWPAVGGVSYRIAVDGRNDEGRAVSSSVESEGWAVGCGSAQAEVLVRAEIARFNHECFVERVDR